MAPATVSQNRSVAQFGSALHWGCRGRRFKSCRSDHIPTFKPLILRRIRGFFVSASLICPCSLLSLRREERSDVSERSASAVSEPHKNCVGQVVGSTPRSEAPPPTPSKPKSTVNTKTEERANHLDPTRLPH